MTIETAYVSAIPVEARQQIAEQRGDNDLERVEYYVCDQLVGIRSFRPDGKLAHEEPYRNGVKHGFQYSWHDSGKLESAEPYENGVPHGTAYQWGRRGTLLGTYTLEHGTGIDLWWEDWHFFHGKWHGIERQWNARGRLDRGYPRYWVNAERVTKAQYLKAAARDSTLPPFRSEDTDPHRAFPPEVAKHLRRKWETGEELLRSAVQGESVQS